MTNENELKQFLHCLSLDGNSEYSFGSPWAVSNTFQSILIWYFIWKKKNENNSDNGEKEQLWWKDNGISSWNCNKTAPVERKLMIFIDIKIDDARITLFGSAHASLERKGQFIMPTAAKPFCLMFFFFFRLFVFCFCLLLKQKTKKRTQNSKWLFERVSN